jgi:hypothetical protein
VAFVAVNTEQAEDWNGASGREFIEQRDRHERMVRHEALCCIPSLAGRNLEGGSWV